MAGGWFKSIATGVLAAAAILLIPVTGGQSITALTWWLAAGVGAAALAADRYTVNTAPPEQIITNPTINSQSGLENARRVHGTKRVGGVRVHEHVAWKDIQYTDVISEGQCSQLLKVYLRGEEETRFGAYTTRATDSAQTGSIPNLGIRPVRPNIDEGRTRFKSFGRVSEYQGQRLAGDITHEGARIYECFRARGDQGIFRQRFNGTIPQNDPRRITNSHKLSFLSYAVLQLDAEYNDPKKKATSNWKSEPRREYLVEGLLVRVPRHASDYDYDNWNLEYAEDPITALLDDLEHIYNFPRARINYPSFVKAYFDCIEPVTRTLTDEQVSEGYRRTAKRYEYHDITPYNMNLGDRIATAEEAMAGQIIDHSGQLHAYAGIDSPNNDPTLDVNWSGITFSEDDLFAGEPITTQTAGDTKSLISEITVSVQQSIAKNFAPEDLPKIENTARLAENNNEPRGPNAQTKHYTFINDPHSAEQLGRIALRLSEAQSTIRAFVALPGANGEHMNLRPGHIIATNFTGDGEGLNYWVILNISLNPDATLPITAYRWLPGVYSVENTFSPTPNLLTAPTPNRAPTPTGLRVVNRVGQNNQGETQEFADVYWDPDAGSIVLEWEYTSVNEGETVDTELAENITVQPHSIPLYRQGTYRVQIKRTAQGYDDSLFTAWLEFNTVGDTIPPANPPGFGAHGNIFDGIQLRVSAPSDDDLQSIFAIIQPDTISDQQLAGMTFTQFKALSNTWWDVQDATKTAQVTFTVTRQDFARTGVGDFIVWATDKSGNHSSDFPFSGD